MWSEIEFRTKARVYFERAEQSDGSLGALLCSLGLEFLLRAPLAAVNPLLLADPVTDDGYSVLHAAGFPGTREPVSVKTKAVLSRLVSVAPGFEAVRKDAQFLIGLRNRELHSSAPVYDDVADHVWLPKFLRVVTLLAQYFKENPSDYMSADFLAHASNLVDVEDQKIRHEISTRINRCREFATKLTTEERTARLEGNLEQPIFLGRWERSVTCPSCGEPVYIQGFPVRYGKEEYDGEGTITQRVFLIYRKFECPVCGLKLESTAEIATTNLPQDGAAVIEESLEERYAPEYEGEYDNE